MTEGEKIVSEFYGVQPSDPLWRNIRALAYMIDQKLNDFLVSTIGTPSLTPAHISAELARVKDLAYRRGREIDELKRQIKCLSVGDIIPSVERAKTATLHNVLGRGPDTWELADRPRRYTPTEAALADDHSDDDDGAFRIDIG